MKVVALGHLLEGDWHEDVLMRFGAWYAQKWPEWYGGEHISPQDLAFRTMLAYRAASVFWQGTSHSLAPLDHRLRRERVIIVVDLTKKGGPDSQAMKTPGEWLVRIPLWYFPVFYAAAVYACEIEHEGWQGRWALTSARQGPDWDPLERPFGWVMQDTTAPPPGDVMYGRPALTIALDAISIVLLHEVAHCLLGHHKRYKRASTGEKRVMEVEADMLAGVFFAGLDGRSEEERKVNAPPAWSAEQASRFARALALLTVVTRWSDTKANVAEKKRVHHRASTRAYHIGLGALTRLHAIKSSNLSIVEQALDEASGILAMYGSGTPLAPYVDVEPEAELDWKSYETVTAPLAREIAADLRNNRVPVLHRILKSLGLEIDTPK